MPSTSGGEIAEPGNTRRVKAGSISSFGQMWLWTSLAEDLYRDDPDYFENFWTKADFDGGGTHPFRHEGIDGSADELNVSTTHSYDRPGAYFSTVRVTSHRDGDLAAEVCRIETIGQARIVVS
ncbi:hypothetical protein [Frankia gtarii]|uniref:hypothetical protein n=1 Tax=Frankia gtarii TaxID=2950102 RepID=UPI0021C0AA96|nr:hypothetical protein [Frankia gtarii]